MGHAWFDGAPGLETIRYGGKMPCVEVRGDDGTLVVLNAGTGIRCLGETLGPEVSRIDLRSLIFIWIISRGWGFLNR